MYYHLPLTARRHLRTLQRSHATPLHTTLPLPVPETMHVDPANICNFRCSFCPTADRELLTSVQRPLGIMDFGLFCSVIDSLKKLVQQHGRRLSVLHLYKDGEPLLNKRFVDMLAYAKSADVTDIVSTTTNGSLLSEETSVRLIESELDRIRISVVHVTDRTYRELTETFGDYARIRKNVAFLYREKRRRNSGLRVFVKINDSALSKDEKRQFEKDFGPIADMLTIDKLMGWSLSEAKDFTLGLPMATGMDGFSPLRDRRVCPEPFSRLAVNFDGQVSACCVDWSYGTIVGDLRRETLGEVWGGETLRDFRLTHLRGRRATIPACANCQYVKGVPLSSDLDEHAQRLLHIYARA